jgi:hypothetical protein
MVQPEAAEAIGVFAAFESGDLRIGKLAQPSD